MELSKQQDEEQHDEVLKATISFSNGLSVPGTSEEVSYNLSSDHSVSIFFD